MVEPILAPNSTWFSQGGTTIKRSQITSIDIVDTYDINGKTIVDQWDASDGKQGTVTAYVESDGNGGYKLTLAGNGYGKVFANPDSSYAFSNSGSDKFGNVTVINGGTLFDTSKATTLHNLFANCAKLESVDVSNWNTGNVTNMQGVFNQAYVLKEAAVENWDTSSATNMAAMFQLARGLTTLDLSKWDVGNVTTMQVMFQGHSSVGDMNLTSIGDVSNWQTGKVENMVGMFNRCSSLESLNLSKWDVGNVKDMESMFERCSSLTTIGDTANWDTSSCTDMSYMFSKCSSLDALDVTNWDVSKVTSMNQMFQASNKLTSIGSTTNWNPAACTNMYCMFYGCTSLEELNVSNWDVSKVATFRSMFGCGNDFGVTPMIISELDVSNWDTSSAEDMSFMFYGCQGPKSIDVSGWDVSKVTTFDHMFAHSYLTIGDTSNWQVSSACTNLNALFHSVQNTTLNVSEFDTSNVTVFDQMFQECTAATSIIGLENFDTSSGLGFSEMFQTCRSLKELDLSSFDTTKAKDGADASSNGSKTTTLSYMFQRMDRLEKITLGEKFSFNGDGTTTVPENVALLPIPGADGNWYDMSGNAFAPSDVPNKAFGVYYASQKIAEEDMNQMVLVKKGNLMRTAAAIRTKFGSTKGYTHEEFADAILSN